MKSIRTVWVWVYLDVEGSARSSVGLFSCENIQKLILRETGKSKPPRHSSPALPSTLSPPPSYTASPWGQAHHVINLRRCPRKKKRAIPAARFPETYISRQRLLGSNAEALWQTTHASSRWPFLFYVTNCTGPNLAGYTRGFFFLEQLPEGPDELKNLKRMIKSSNLISLKCDRQPCHCFQTKCVVVVHPELDLIIMFQYHIWEKKHSFHEQH